MAPGESLFQHKLRRPTGVGVNMTGYVGISGFMYKERRGEAERDNIGGIACIA